MEIAILQKIRRKINHANPFNRRLAEIKEAAAIAVNINALQTRAPLEEVPSLVEPILEGDARDYPVIRPGAARRRGFKQHWKLSLYSKEDLTEGWCPTIFQHSSYAIQLFPTRSEWRESS